jgi:hypothetical protein
VKQTALQRPERSRVCRDKASKPQSLNELDLSVYRNGGIFYFTGADGKVESINFRSRWSAESQGSRITAEARKLALQAIYCGADLTKAIIEVIGENNDSAKRYRNGTISVEYIRFAHPTPADFRALRFAAWSGDRICRVSGTLQNPDALTIEYLPAGRAQLTLFGIPLSMSAAQVTRAAAFPCDAEIATAAYWFDRGSASPRSADDTAALLNLFAAKTKPVFACFSAYRALDSLIDLSSPTEYALTHGTCDTDLASAKAYIQALAGSPDQANAQAFYDAAMDAHV